MSLRTRLRTLLFRAVIEPYLRHIGLSEAKLAYEAPPHRKANWKLVWENNRSAIMLRQPP